MFQWLKKDPLKKLENEYSKKSEAAMKAQRNGNIELFSKLSQECESLVKKMEKIESANEIKL